MTGVQLVIAALPVGLTVGLVQWALDRIREGVHR